MTALRATDNTCNLPKVNELIHDIHTPQGVPSPRNTHATTNSNFSSYFTDRPRQIRGLTIILHPAPAPAPQHHAQSTHSRVSVFTTLQPAPTALPHSLLPFPLRGLSAPLLRFLHHIMRLPPPIPFSFSGASTRLSIIHFRFFASNAASGPAPPSHRPTTYFVPRNSRGSLPVYSDIRNGGTRYLISVRNVDGNIKVGDTIPHDHSPLIRITRHWLMIYFATFPTLHHQSQVS